MEGITIMADRPPKQVFIELTTACNFNCDYCPYHLVTRKKSVMSLESLRRIVAEIQRLGEPVEYVMFSAMGEPLLYPHIEEACKIVRDAGFRLYVTTNGALLRDAHKKIQIDNLYISFRSTGPDSFTHRRARISFDQYIAILSRFLVDNTQNTTIYFSFNDDAQWPQNNEKNWMDILDYSQKDELLASMNTYCKKLIPEFQPVTCLPAMDTYIQTRENVKIYFCRMYSWSNIMLPPNYFVFLADRIECCDYNEKHIVFYANGDVTTCCMDYNGEFVAGNILKEPLDAIVSRRPRAEQLTQYNFCRVCKGRPNPSRKR
jgi:MoaA/NifB/PqqE/SkfB family radical SAM enzyme